MAKPSAKNGSSPPDSQTLLLDPFNGVLAIFFFIMAVIVPDAFPASDGKLNALHLLTLAVFCLLGAFFAWRWLRVVFWVATRDEVEEDVIRTRSTTFSKDAKADTSPQPPSTAPEASTPPSSPPGSASNP
jgi:hypothetical protein